MARNDDLSTPRGTPGGPTYDPDAFARFAEKMARFLGTGRYLAAQTIFVILWIILNGIAFTNAWDPYPFILLNLAFSLQAAYAAPLILLAQTRQADRDKANALADALHREELHQASEDRLKVSAQQTALLVEMMEQNTRLTETVKDLTERVETLTQEVHGAVCTKLRPTPT